MRYRFVGTVVLLAIGICARVPAAGEDWSKAARDDLAAARATLLAQSPGGVPGEAPAFLADLDRATAKADAGKIESYAGYRFALAHFANVFQDDHLWIDFDAPLPARWPGFLVGYRGGAFRIVDTAAPNDALLGAVLEGCDGVPVAALAQARLEAYDGRWTVESSRREVAPLLLLDRGNPFLPLLRRCDWRRGGASWSDDLDWRELPQDEYRARLAKAQGIAPQPQGGVRATAGGGFWVGIPTLNALNPQAVAGLETLMAEIEAKAPAVRAARYVVVDLRGNNGGNTFVALRVLNAIWGAGAVAAVRPKNLQAEWRASPQNLAYLDAVEPVIKKMFGERSVAYGGFDRVRRGLARAIKNGDPLYIDPDEYAILDVAADAPRHAVSAVPYLLTDGACVSSCLNLVDLVLKLPHVVQIGAETQSDTFLLENRPAPLPSGHAVLQFPIKLYRHRERLANQSYKPAVAWPGDIADTAALETWVAALAAR